MSEEVNTEYDVLVIGGGPAGENAGARAAEGGLRVGLIERDLLGGECSYWACMPSKALLRPGEALAAVRRTPGAAAAVTGNLDVEAVFERRDRLSSEFDDAGQVAWAENADLDVIRGHGRLTGERTVSVEDEHGVTTRYEVSTAVVLATGTAAAWPAIPGLAEADVWDNRRATTAKAVPRRLLVIGGGVVGTELGQAWRSLGSQEVTIVEMQDRLLPREEPFAGEQLERAFDRLGIRVKLATAVTDLERSGSDGPVTVSLSDGSSVETDEVLVAVGRRPLTDDIGLETIGIEPGEFVAVDDHMRASGVSGDWLYAVGDINARALLTHTGKYQARIAGDNIAGRGDQLTAFGDIEAVPRVVFTDPNIAAVGLTEAEAREKGIETSVVDYELGRVAGSATLGRGVRGTCRIVVDDERRVIVGATFVGPGTAEMIHAATIAIVAEVPLERLWHAIPAFPTQSEIWLRLLEEYGL